VLPPTPKPPDKYRAKIYCQSTGADTHVDQLIVLGVQALESVLNMPVWLFSEDSAQANPGRFQEIDHLVYYQLMLARAAHLKKGQPIALVIHSSGGLPEPAYRIARLLQQHCGSFIAVVPERAMSAATLLSLGAEQIYLSDTAQLGPLDLQKWDTTRDRIKSALEGVQIFEKTNEEALKVLQRTLEHLRGVTGKAAGQLLPEVLKYTADVVRPLYEQIDPYDFIREYRDLAFAREYAKRLLSTSRSSAEADKIARQLVAGYETHSFVIDRPEARSMGLKIMAPNAEIERACEMFVLGLWKQGILGPIEKEVPEHGNVTPNPAAK
jgi:hypothetical protein